MTVQKLKDRVLELGISPLNESIIGNILVALSGFMLYSDKVFAFIGLTFTIPSKWEDAGMDFPTFVWFLSQTISPMVWAVSTRLFKTQILFHVIPLYCYILQLYFIFSDFKIIDNTYLQWYVIGTTILVTIAFVFAWYRLRKDVELSISNAKQKILGDDE